MEVTIDIKELETFLNYLQDKVDEVYKMETNIAIKTFLEEKELSKCKESINMEYSSPLF
ncbi:hypothetical protein [Ruoffia tabacinasalis]|uniref:hypothetical protein n=1 Tax=Ruoffia tabacinasalis TaxID=87458 RepID=UPI001486EE2F|nr:hypothetical protein [Ruoffia tabacinasalis]